MLIHTAKEVGALVRECRTRKQLTQARLAAAVGVSRKWIIGLEGGKPTAELSLALRTLRTLGVVLDATDRAGRTNTSAIDLDAIVADARRPKR